MYLLKIFLATLLLGVVVSVFIAFLYPTTYSVASRSLDVSPSVEVNEASLRVERNETRTLKEDKGKGFSLREQMTIHVQQLHTSEQTHLQTKANDLQNAEDLDSISEGSDHQEEFIDKQDETSDHLFLGFTADISYVSENNQASTPEIVVKPDINTLTNKTVVKLLALQPVSQNSQQCDPRINIVLLKTHKTGSSTVQNILYRFGDVRGLSFVLPAVDVYMGTPNHFKLKYILQTPGGYNILANHARFHKTDMAKIMPANTKYISILRFPPKQFESMYSYYGLQNTFHTSLEGFANNTGEIYTKYEGPHPMHSILNPVLYDLGLSKGDLSRPSQVDKWIKFIDESFDFILIAEYFQESLILLKEIMCWTMKDIVYFRSNKRHDSQVNKLTNRTVEQLLDWHSGDYKLYQHFNKTLHLKIEQYGIERMKKDVELLNERNRELADECLKGTTPVGEGGNRTFIDRYVLKPGAKQNRLCSRMTYAAVDYLKMLRQKQLLRRPGRKA